ncbi:TPA: type III secretion system effector EspN, partial [Escherichia coli O103:H2]|nr:type III secretion system effector EspN [Escherichia coli]
VISNNEMKKSIKISELVIHNIIKKGLTNCLLKKDVLNARYDLIRDILRYSLNIRQGIKHDDVNRISENIIKKYGITEGMNPKPRNARISKELLLLAVDRQIEWAKKHFITKDVLENVVSKCDLSSIFNVNKVLQNTILEFVHEINNISSARWMSKSEKNNKQKEAIEKFKKEVSHMNGGQQFIWGFDKVIQEGLSGLIELSIDINDSTNHRDKSSLSPDGRAVLHFLGTIWNMAMGAVPGYNALSGVSSILHSAIVKESSNICDYIQGAVRIGMDFVPGTRSDLHSRSLQIKYEALKHIEKNINDNIIYHPSNNANFYSVIESIDGNDFIYNEKQSKILEMKQDRGGNRYSAVDLNSSKYGYYEKVGGGFYRYIESFNPISSETPNKIVYKGESVDLTKEPNSELYSGRYSINNKQVNVYFFRDADGTFYKSEGLHGGGVIRYIDKPYSQLREGDIGYDEDLLDIYDDSPVLEDTLPALSSEIVPTPEHSIKQIYSKIKEGHIELSDSDIILCRGTTGIQAENIVEYKTAGGLPDSNPNVKAPDEYMAQQQVRIGRILPEYTSDLSVADRFSREHYLIVVKVKAKYITRGSVTESGWVIDKTAPVEPLAIIDRTFGMKENISMVNASK